MCFQGARPASEIYTSVDRCIHQLVSNLLGIGSPRSPAFSYQDSQMGNFAVQKSWYCSNQPMGSPKSIDLEVLDFEAPWFWDAAIGDVLRVTGKDVHQPSHQSGLPTCPFCRRKRMQLISVGAQLDIELLAIDRTLRWVHCILIPALGAASRAVRGTWRFPQMIQM